MNIASKKSRYTVLSHRFDHAYVILFANSFEKNLRVSMKPFFRVSEKVRHLIMINYTCTLSVDHFYLISRIASL